MNTITVEKGINLKKKVFDNFNQLFLYLIEKKVVSYIEIGFLDKNEISEKSKKLYGESKKLKKNEFIDVTDK